MQPWEPLVPLAVLRPPSCLRLVQRAAGRLPATRTSGLSACAAQNQAGVRHYLGRRALSHDELCRLYILRRVQAAAEHGNEKLLGLIASFTEKTEFESAPGEDRRRRGRYRAWPVLTTALPPAGHSGRLGATLLEYPIAARPASRTRTPSTPSRRSAASAAASRLPCTPSTRQTTAAKW